MEDGILDNKLSTLLKYWNNKKEDISKHFTPEEIEMLDLYLLYLKTKLYLSENKMESRLKDKVELLYGMEEYFDESIITLEESNNVMGGK